MKDPKTLIFRLILVLAAGIAASSCGGGSYGGGDGGGGGGGAATLNISIDPDTIAVGESATITWNTNGNTCTASGDWAGTKDGDGSEDVSPDEAGELHLSHDLPRRRLWRKRAGLGDAHGRSDGAGHGLGRRRLLRRGPALRNYGPHEFNRRAALPGARPSLRRQAWRSARDIRLLQRLSRRRQAGRRRFIRTALRHAACAFRELLRRSKATISLRFRAATP